MSQYWLVLVCMYGSVCVHVPPVTETEQNNWPWRQRQPSQPWHWLNTQEWAGELSVLLSAKPQGSRVKLGWNPTEDTITRTGQPSFRQPPPPRRELSKVYLGVKATRTVQPAAFFSSTMLSKWTGDLFWDTPAYFSVHSQGSFHVLKTQTTQGNQLKFSKFSYTLKRFWKTAIITH